MRAARGVEISVIGNMFYALVRHFHVQQYKKSLSEKNAAECEYAERLLVSQCHYGMFAAAFRLWPRY